MHVVFVHAYFYYSLFLYVNLDFHWAFLHFNLKSLVSICCGSSLLVVDCISVVRVKTSLIHPPLFKDLFAKHRILVRNFYQLFLFKIFSVFWSTWFMIRRPLFLDLFLCTVIFFFCPLLLLITGFHPICDVLCYGFFSALLIGSLISLNL